MRRGDAGTVREHGVALTTFAAATGAVDVVAGYRALARSATGRALAAGLIGPAAAQELLDGINEDAGTLQVDDGPDPQEDAMTTQTTTPTLVHTRGALAAALAVQDVQAVPRTEGARWARRTRPARTGARSS